MKLSVITVSYNSHRFISQTIESVIAQTDIDLEYIIIDGGSTDGTVDLIRRYAELDDRISWVSEPDKGIADAMNKGVMKATGDVIAHLNSDDYYSHPQVLNRVSELFTNNSMISWLTGGFTFVSENGTFIRDIRVRHYSYRRLLRGNILLHPTTFIRRELFELVGGFDISLRYCMDYDLFLRLGSRVDPLSVDEQLTCFRVHAASRSLANTEQAYAEEYQVRKKYVRHHVIRSLFYAIDYQIKRHLNRLFYQGIFTAKAQADIHVK